MGRTGARANTKELERPAEGKQMRQQMNEWTKEQTKKGKNDEYIIAPLALFNISIIRQHDASREQKREESEKN